MDTRTQDRVEEWDARSFSGGFDGLRELADDEFTGAVESAGRWLFMLNGRIVGVFDGDLDDFEDGSGTVYTAPDPALVMLCTMWETGGETKAKYYTNDTPIEEVDDTLSSGSFTGFLELSENVLSGDYYVCYYGGRSLPVAWVGNSEQLLTGDEAFERANGEVGIYEVRDVDIDVVELPDPEPEPDDDGGAAAGGVVTDSAADETDASGEEDGATTSDDVEDPGATGSDDAMPMGPPDDASTTDADESTADSGGRVAERTPSRDDATADADAGASSDRTTAGESDQPSETEPTRDPTGGATRSGDDRTGGGRATGGTRNDADPTNRDDLEADPDDVVAAPPAEEVDADSNARNAAERTRSDRTTRDRATGERGAEAGASGARPQDRAGGQGGDPLAESPSDDSDPRFEREAEWRETTTIPSIDPDHSEEAAETHAADAAGASQGADRRRGTESGTPRANGARRSGNARNAADTGGSGGEPLEREMLEREDKIDRLQQQVSNLEAERDKLRAECERLRSEAESGEDVEQLREERDELASENEQLRERAESLQEEVESLQAEIDRLEDALEEARAAAPEDDTPDAARSLSPAAALSGTNLFVRYASKGEDTLADAHSATATRSDVNDNLRLEHHTSFEADDVAVGDVPYEQFLRESIEFGFVDWAVRTLLFEIRETGNQDELRDLYDTLPEVDRAELDGTVELDPADDEDVPAEIDFDVVLRNRMGAPLVVANVNDSREPATEGMMVQLNEDAGAVKERHDEFVGAFMVTTSFFEPGALETADEATSGSFLSRDSRKSFVKLTRKRGYHLCLVETRDGNFHVNVPEL
jgi:hypothetical protein